MTGTQQTTHNTVLVTATDRFGISLFFATAIHALIIFGIVFHLPLTQLPNLPKRSLEITLAHYRSDKAPEVVDFLAQANQQGGGKKATELIPTTPYRPPFPAPTIEELTQAQRTPTPPTAHKTKRNLITTLHSQTQARAPKHRTGKPTDQSPDTMKKALKRAIAIASLTAHIDAMRQAQAKRPKRRHISAATHEARDARYLDAWRRRIETIGNLNYPDEARRKRLSGELRLLVAINKDGSLNNIVVRRSSGKKILDDAAVRIVKLAAPFPPLTKAMQRDTDILEIIRTWQFRKDNKLYAKG